MAVENGVWTMYGMDWDDPYRIRSFRELINWINEIGFLPFFKNEIEGFSAEEHTSNRYWQTGDKEQDPWEWRETIARIGEVFRQKRNKKGAEYGMAVSVYMTPEELWGYDLVTSAYKETLESSRERIYRHVQEHYPDAVEKQIRTLMK